MKIDLYYPLKGLDGKDLQGKEEEIIAAKILAPHLAYTKIDTDLNPLKLFNWAQSLYQNGWIEIDESDLKELKKLVAKYPLPPITLAQIKLDYDTD